MSFRDKGEVKTFSDERKLRELVASRPALKEWFKEEERRLLGARRGGREMGKEKRKNTVSKEAGNYNRVSFSSCLF